MNKYFVIIGDQFTQKQPERKIVDELKENDCLKCNWRLFDKQIFVALSFITHNYQMLFVQTAKLPDLVYSGRRSQTESQCKPDEILYFRQHPD